MGAAVARTVADLGEDDLDRLAAQLVPLIGEEASRATAWRQRLAWYKDGATLIELRVPKIPAGFIAGAFPGYLSIPWEIAGAMDSVATFLPLEVGVRLLTGPDSPEAELARRQKLLADHVAAQEAAGEARIQHAREAREKERAHKAARPSRWLALPREAKLYYLAAAQRPTTVHDALIAMARLSTGVSERELSQVPASFEPELLP